MTVLVNEGFEAPLDSNWILWNTPEIQSFIKYSGLSAVMCKPYDVVIRKIAPLPNLTVEAVVFIDTLPPVSGGEIQAQPLKLQTAGYGDIAQVVIVDYGSGPVLSVYSPLGGGVFVPYPFQANTWYRFKFEYTAAVDGGWRLSVNEEEIINTAGIDTSSLLPELVFLAVITYAGNIYTDDAVISDTVTPPPPPPVTHTVSFSGLALDEEQVSTPLAVTLTLNSQQLPSGQSAQVSPGISHLSVPSEVTV